jgi:hypothetical protein
MISSEHKTTWPGAFRELFLLQPSIENGAGPALHGYKESPWTAVPPKKAGRLIQEKLGSHIKGNVSAV